MENELKKFTLDDRTYFTNLTKKFQKRKQYQYVDPSLLRAFIPGIIQKIYVSEGQEVERFTPLLVLEAMKMRNEVRSNVKGVVKKILVKEGDVVNKDQVLVEFVLK